MSRRFWRCVSTGAYCTHGETFYDDNDVLWWAKGGTLKGESPARIAFCRKIIESLPGHLEGETSFLQRLIPIYSMPEDEKKAAIDRLPESAKKLVLAFLASGSGQAQDFGSSEVVWYGHIGQEVFLRFHDTRPIARDTLELPENKTYRIDVLDTWNMTRETVAGGVSGKYTVMLPGREDMAVLALAE